MEAQVESWILKFDQDMGERQSEIEAVQEQYDAELAQLEELQNRFDALESEYNAIMEQRRIEVRAGDDTKRLSLWHRCSCPYLTRMLFYCSARSDRRRRKR